MPRTIVIKTAFKIGLLSVFVNLSQTFVANADDQTEIAFADGNVHIYCRTPSDADENVFLESFPQLIVNLQKHADEGRVIRAHFLKELKHGIFIAVAGEDRAEAKKNAQMILDENRTTIDTAVKNTGAELDEKDADGGCQIIEVGPVAILPKN